VPTGNFQRIYGDPRTKILADLLILRGKSHFGDDRYHNRRIFEGLEKLRDGEELNWDEYESLRLFVEDLQNNGHLSYEDILKIEEIFHEQIGAPLHGWRLYVYERGKIDHSEFGILDEVGGEIARMSMWFLDPDTGEVPDWDDDDVYANRKEFLEGVEMALLDFECIDDDEAISESNFIRRSLPFIQKFASDEGVGLKYDHLSINKFDPEFDAIMGSYGFDITKKHFTGNTYMTDYVWDYRKFNPKYTIWVME